MNDRVSRRALAAVLLLAALPARAGTVLVRQDGTGDATTIRGALAMAAVGDTVLVGPGLYTEVPTGTAGPGIVLGANVLVSEAGPLFTTIDPFGNPLVTAALEILSPDAVVDGFRFEGTPPGASAIYLTDSDGGSTIAQIRNCEFRDINAGGAGTTAAIAMKWTGTRGEPCDVSDCRFVGCFRGIRMRSTRGTVTNCVFELCEDRGLWAGSTDVAVSGCTFRFNPDGGALFGGGDWSVTDCWFEGNQTSGGGGAAIHAYTAGGNPAVIQNSVFLNNRATNYLANYGGAISFYAAGAGLTPVYITGNTFYGNEAEIGSTISLNGPDCEIRNNLFARSRSGNAVIQSHNHPVAVSTCNLFWEVDIPIGGGFYSPTVDDFVDVDPLFCDELHWDLTLAANSVALPAQSPQCGQIGAFGEGCAAISIEALSWGAIKALYRR